jgi:hypothetical protein
MIKGIFKYYACAGVYFTYNGLKDGQLLSLSVLSLLLAWASFFMAIVEYKKMASEKD